MIHDLLNAKSFNEMKQIHNKYMSRHTKYGQEVSDKIKVMLKEQPKLRPSDYPVTTLDRNDYWKRICYTQLQKTRVESVCAWK